MDLLTKNEAGIMAEQYTDTLMSRVNDFLRNQARLGSIGGIFVYTVNDTGPKATAVVTALQAAGWTVTLDVPTRRALIS